MRKVVFMLCLALFFATSTSVMQVHAAYTTGFDINAKSVYLVNLETGTVLLEKDPHEKMQPASTVKMMTCILVLENVDNLQATFKYPEYVFSSIKKMAPAAAQADVRQGEEMTVENALYCMMLQSDCYSALALADYVSEGDVDAFVTMMNEKAQEIGAVNTLFTNPHGLSDENMYTTAYDLYLIADYARKVEGLMDICSTATKELPPTNIPAHQNPDAPWRLITTIKPMLGGSYKYEPLKGIKTGSLPEVGHHFVSTATRDGYSYLCVLMGADYLDADGAALDPYPVFVDAKNIYEWAFNYFTVKQLLEKGKSAGEVLVNMSAGEDHVTVLAAEDFFALVPSDAVINPTDGGEGVLLVPHLLESTDAPVKKASKLGTMDIVYGDILGTVDLLAESAVDRSHTKFVWSKVKDVFASIWVKFVVVLVILVLATYITLMVLRNRYRKRYRRARSRRHK